MLRVRTRLGVLNPIAVLAAAAFMSGLTMRMAEPLVPNVANEFDVGVGAGAVIVTGFSLSYGLFQIAHGPLADRVGKLRVVAATLVVAAAGCVACALASSLWVLAAARFLTGIGAGGIMPLALAYLGDNVPFADRQLAIGRFLAGVVLGVAVGPVVGGLLGDAIGWRAAFVVPALGFVVLGLLLAPIARRENAPAPAPPEPWNPLPRYLALARIPTARAVLVAAALEAFLFFGSFAYLGAFLRHEFSLSYSAIGGILAGYGLGGIAYSLLVQVLLRRMGQGGLVATGGMVVLGSFVALALAPGWGLCVPLVALLGLSLLMFHNTLQTHATEMTPGARGLAVSAFVFCLFGGQTIGVTVFGPLVESLGYRPMFIVSGCGIAVLALWYRRRQSLPSGAGP
jgi:predicted MFS family arabinose efflux permease